jgi:hypothetical protein
MRHERAEAAPVAERPIQVEFADGLVGIREITQGGGVWVLIME